MTDCDCDRDSHVTYDTWQLVTAQDQYKPGCTILKWRNSVMGPEGFMDILMIHPLVQSENIIHNAKIILTTTILPITSRFLHYEMLESETSCENWELWADNTNTFSKGFTIVHTFLWVLSSSQFRHKNMSTNKSNTKYHTMLWSDWKISIRVLLISLQPWTLMFRKEKP